MARRRAPSSPRLTWERSHAGHARVHAERAPLRQEQGRDGPAPARVAGDLWMRVLRAGAIDGVPCGIQAAERERVERQGTPGRRFRHVPGRRAISVIARAAPAAQVGGPKMPQPVWGSPHYRIVCVRSCLVEHQGCARPDATQAGTGLASSGRHGALDHYSCRPLDTPPAARDRPASAVLGVRIPLSNDSHDEAQAR